MDSSMCLQEFSLVLTVFGMHNICKSVGTMKKIFCSWSSQSSDYFNKHFKITGIIIMCVRR